MRCILAAGLLLFAASTVSAADAPASDPAAISTVAEAKVAAPSTAPVTSLDTRASASTTDAKASVSTLDAKPELVAEAKSPTADAKTAPPADAKTADTKSAGAKAADAKTADTKTAAKAGNAKSSSDSHWERAIVFEPAEKIVDRVVELGERTSSLTTRLTVGIASYYASRFHGRRTASGTTYDETEMTAAHRTLPFGTRLKVTNLANLRSVIVKVTDRGPFVHGRVLDLSRGAARELRMIDRGIAQVRVEQVEQ